MNLLKKIICKFLPELTPVFDKSVSFNLIKNTLLNVNQSELTKLYSPYQISNSNIGKGTYISSNSKISNTTIGKFCSIGPNLICGWGIHPTNALSTSPYFYSLKKQNGSTIAKEEIFTERESINIGNDVFIGANVTILDGVTIGDGVIIGAGAVVSKDIPNFAIAVGVPIKIEKFRFTKEQQEKLKEISWWNFDEVKLKQVNQQFYNIEEFILQNTKL